MMDQPTEKELAAIGEALKAFKRFWKANLTKTEDAHLAEFLEAFKKLADVIGKEG